MRSGVQAVRQQANVVRQNLAAAQRNFQANMRNFQACVQGGPQFAGAGGGSLGTQGAKFEKNVQQFVQSNPAKYKPRGAGAAGKAPKSEKKCLFEGNSENSLPKPIKKIIDEEGHQPKHYDIKIKVGKTERNAGRTVYQKKIDPNHSHKGETNLKRMKKGKNPYDEEGNVIELHHIDQEEPGPMIELPCTTHRGKGSGLHNNKKESFRKDPALNKQYRNFRKAYWKERANEFKEGAE